MSDDADFLRRERVTDALLEFERRIRNRTLAISHAECWDLLLNRPAGGPVPLRYETRAAVGLLRLNDPAAVNRACPRCELFGRSHCCGGLVFLYYALRDAGVSDPMRLLAVELAPSVYLADWERLEEHSRDIVQALRTYFEARLDRVSALD
jgi:hypothetical protein